MIQKNSAHWTNDSDIYTAAVSPSLSDRSASFAEFRAAPFLMRSLGDWRMKIAATSTHGVQLDPIRCCTSAKVLWNLSDQLIDSSFSKLHSKQGRQGCRGRGFSGMVGIRNISFLLHAIASHVDTSGNLDKTKNYLFLSLRFDCTKITCSKGLSLWRRPYFVNDQQSNSVGR